MLARVPLASGLLTGKLTAASTFEPDDHRQYNRHGESFDVGETFAGVDYETGLAVVEELRALVPEGATLAQVALRWILMHDGVTRDDPGRQDARSRPARTPRPADLAPLARGHDGPRRRALRGPGQAARPPALVGLGDERPRPLGLRRGDGYGPQRPGLRALPLLPSGVSSGTMPRRGTSAVAGGPYRWTAQSEPEGGNPCAPA